MVFKKFEKIPKYNTTAIHIKTDSTDKPLFYIYRFCTAKYLNMM